MCGDEIWIEGTDHWVFKANETPNGRILNSWRTNYKGTGVGTPSGNTSSLNGTWGGQVSVDADGPVRRDWCECIGHGQVPNIHWKSRYHVTINAPGDIVVERSFFDVKCQGY